MQDKIFVYTDFILTIQRLTLILQNLAYDACSHLEPTISGEQILYFYHLLSNPNFEELEDKKYNRKNFYYTIKKLEKTGYLTLETNKRNIIALKATEKGKNILDCIEGLFTKQFKQLVFHGMNVTELSHILTLVYRFEKFWMHLLKGRIN